MSQDFNYQEALLQCKTMEDITGKNGLVQKIIKDAVEHILGQELEDYISQKNSSGDKVSRNGSTTKNIKTAYGNIGVRVPRTREPGFEPEVVKKRAVIDEGLEPQITSMYAKGMSVRDIAEHLQALYGIELSATSISNITDKVSQEAKDWYSRTLESFYPAVFLDAVHFKVREEGRIVAKAAYAALGMSGEGFKDILGIRLRFIRKTHCQKDFMLWRGSARLGGVGGVDFNVLGNPAELVRKLEMNADIAVFVNLDMVYQLNQNFPGQLFDVLIFRKGYQRGMLLVNAV